MNNTSNLFLNLASDAGFKVDIMFLADSTGSMGNAIDNVKANFVESYSGLLSNTRWDAACGVAYYKDSTDPDPFKVLQQITKDPSLLQTAVNKLVASGGGDTPEGQLYALTQLATRATTGWRPGAARIIAWFGDEAGHDPSQGCTVTSTINELLEKNVQVCAFSCAPSNNLDSTSQATRITEGADGVTTNKYVQYNVAQSGVAEFIFNFVQGNTP